ncbi:ANTAR domain-containing protein [Streptomyces actinomycinicus]|uniref:ANTAR domain-containing protein n=1 Tax=Streptomyces actinomycinicus TaxID=1695166 RepID=A0A937EQ33_9ACTN|nr:ANTAR domain-containing protein [Streptomyces actinomycinicus]MBL1087468.1 ANTAR domain-containing protein [Streptomyces actinomycinicus]
MTSHDAQRPTPQSWPPDGSPAGQVERLMRENAQLREAIDSHAVVDQAIGVLIALDRIPPSDGGDVLREVSQHTNIKLRVVAEAIVDWAQSRELVRPVRDELDAALRRLRQRRSVTAPADGASPNADR